jgi:Tfp pilus assembly protein PilO
MKRKPPSSVNLLAAPRIVTVAAACVVGALVLWVVMWPSVAGISARWTRLRQLRAQTAEARVLIADQSAQSAALAQARERYRRMEHQVSDSRSVARILEELHQHARDSRVQLISVQARKVALTKGTSFQLGTLAAVIGDVEAADTGATVSVKLTGTGASVQIL